MSRSSTGRSKNDWRGRTTQSCVREGNRHVTRSALLMTLAYAHGQGFILEQPMSSMMLDSRPMLWVRDRARLMGMLWAVVETYMSAFKPDGHLKPTILATNRESVMAMQRSRPPITKACSVVHKTVRSDGKNSARAKKETSRLPNNIQKNSEVPLPRQSPMMSTPKQGVHRRCRRSSFMILT